MHYRFDRLDFSDDTAAARERRHGWLQAVQRGFHEGRADDDLERIWLDHVAADGVECRGAWLPDDAFGAGPIPVATTAWFDKTLNTGRGLLPLRMITDVTTSPSHRRRGLVRRLMEDCLADAVANDVPLAALTVSEATIYGRWGFGAATFAQSVELDTGPRFGLRDFTDPGRVELVDPRSGWPVVSAQLDRFHHASRGSVGTPQFYDSYFTGAWSFREQGPDKHLRCAVHLTPDGTVDGVTIYRVDRRDDAGSRTVKVLLLLGDDPTATLGLWTFLAGIDLVHKVSWHAFAPDDPLPWALVDMNALKVTGHEEFLWVRVLDVPAAFAARPWVADDELVVEVVDAQRHAGGRWLVRTVDGKAETTATEDEPDLVLDAETLGSLYLSGVGVGTLHRAGRLTGTADAAARFAAMADLPDPPHNILGF